MSKGGRRRTSGDEGTTLGHGRNEPVERGRSMKGGLLGAIPSALTTKSEKELDASPRRRSSVWLLQTRQSVWSDTWSADFLRL
jgi:hypothetical protein